MDHEKTFKTKTGFCHVLPDKIILTRDGIIGNVAKVATGSHISRILTIYGALSLGLFYFAYDHFIKEQTTPAIIFCLAGIYLAFGIAKSIRNSATPVIDRQKIREVRFKKAIPGLTRSRFEVFFENEQGRIKKRLIMLPGSLSGGENETEKAVQIMTGENLIAKR